MIKIRDLSGKRFGKLTVIEFNGKNKFKKPLWKCKCDCGNEAVVAGENLTKKIATKSCGCLRLESNTKHNKCKTSIYNVWNGMIQRCTDIKNSRYKSYMGRGITVCDKWLTFEGFYEDMGDRPKGMSLDRVDNNGNYCNENCKWSTPKEQSNNTRKNHPLTFNGKTQNITQWSEELNISWTVLQSRINRKWSTERALTEKVISKPRKGSA